MDTQRRLIAMHRMVHHLIQEAEDLHQQDADGDALLHILQHLGSARELLRRSSTASAPNPDTSFTAEHRHDH